MELKIAIRLLGVADAEILRALEVSQHALYASVVFLARVGYISGLETGYVADVWSRDVR